MLHLDIVRSWSSPTALRLRPSESGGTKQVSNAHVSSQVQWRAGQSRQLLGGNGFLTAFSMAWR